MDSMRIADPVWSLKLDLLSQGHFPQNLEKLFPSTRTGSISKEIENYVLSDVLPLLGIQGLKVL